MNVNSLYPVVHDLTDVDSYGCFDTSYLCAVPGCFNIQDLVNPGDASSIPVSTSIEIADPYNKQPSSSNLFRQNSSHHPAEYTEPPLPQSLLDNRSDEGDEEGYLRFSDVYVLTRQVNKGKVSNVWECIHRKSGVRYAAKIVDRRRLTPRDEDLVYQEVSMLSEIRGGSLYGITKLVDFFDEDTHFYIILDYAEGGDFLTTLVKVRHLAELDAQDLARSLLRALIYLHKNKICHRNLKPENILLKNRRDMSTAVIADYGMTTRILTDTDGDDLKLTERCGTAAYMAPEMISHSSYDTQADVWSFGVIIFYALAGCLPFEDVSEMPSKRVLYHKIVKCDYYFDPQQWSGISKNAKRFIANILHDDPEVRMTAEEALNHPWLSAHSTTPPAADMATSTTPIATAAAAAPKPELSSCTSTQTSKTQQTETIPVTKKQKRMTGVWRVMTCGSKKNTEVVENEIADETKSVSSTVSMISSNAKS